MALIGQTLSHCLVERRLGAGGMGEVFLPRDLALGRPAAVKVLAQPLSSAFRSRLERDGMLAEADDLFRQARTAGSREALALPAP